MADGAAFDWICNRLERDTSLDRRESRGTLRLALRAAGLDAHSAMPDQLMVVAQNELVAELSARGIDDAEDLCARLAAGLESEAVHLASVDAGGTSDATSSRLGD